MVPAIMAVGMDPGLVGRSTMGIPPVHLDMAEALPMAVVSKMAVETILLTAMVLPVEVVNDRPI